jgi:hypothetical protein
MLGSGSARMRGQTADAGSPASARARIFAARSMSAHRATALQSRFLAIPPNSDFCLPRAYRNHSPSPLGVALLP